MILRRNRKYVERKWFPTVNKSTFKLLLNNECNIPFDPSHLSLDKLKVNAKVHKGDKLRLICYGCDYFPILPTDPSFSESESKGLDSELSSDIMNKNQLEYIKSCDKKYFIDLDPNIHKTYLDILMAYESWINKIRLEEYENDETKCPFRTHYQDCGHDIEFFRIDNYWIFVCV